MNDYKVTREPNGQVKVKRNSVTDELDKHGDKTWLQLNTQAKIDLLASFYGITPDTLIKDIPHS